MALMYSYKHQKTNENMIIIVTKKVTLSIFKRFRANLLFPDVATGFPGRMHDSHVLRPSSLLRRAEQNELLKIPEDIIGNLRVRPLFTWRWWISTLQMVYKTIQFYACIKQHWKKSSTRNFHILVQLLKDRLVFVRYAGAVC